MSLYSLAENKDSVNLQSNPPEYDSVQLKSQFIFICEGHYFEWDHVASICQHCYEPLVKKDLWFYHNLLECEDCKAFFDENYSDFLDPESIHLD